MIGPCLKCGADGFAVAADTNDNGADLCLEHAQQWLRTVAWFVDYSLPVFTGTADADEQQRHAENATAHADTEAAEAVKHAKRERAERNAARQAAARSKAKTRRRPSERVAAAQADANRRVRAAGEGVAHRAEEIARLVRERPRTATEVAEALGVSPRTATRAIADAKSRGLIVAHYGRGAIIEPAQRAQKTEQIAA